MLQRVHGGAYPVESAGFESNIKHRSTSLVGEKRRIAAAAAERLHGAETVYVDEGVTPQFVAEAIRPDSPITVVTSSLLAAGALADSPQVTVLLLGGRMRGRTLATVDHWALRMLSDLVIDLAFLGANGISRDHGLTTPDPAVAAVKARGRGALAPPRIFVGLHTKFGAASFCRFAEISDFEVLVTDTGLSPRRGPSVLRARTTGGPGLAPPAAPFNSDTETSGTRPGVQPEVTVKITSTKRIAMALALPAVAGLTLSGCAGAGGGGGGGGSDSKSINVLMVGNPQMVDIQKLTKDSFTKDTGIKVNYTVLPENELRDKVTQDVATGAGQYDVATVGAYEVPIWAKNGWLHRARQVRRRGRRLRQGRPAQADHASRCRARTASSTALPFYGESSFLMYRKDIFEEEGHHDARRARPGTQVADDRRQARRRRARHEGHLPARPARLGRDARPADHGGQHLRRHLVRPRTGTRSSTRPAFKQAVNFYVNLIKAHGEPGASQAGFTECPNAMSQSKVAMWYDATSAAGRSRTRACPRSPARSATCTRRSRRPTSSGWLWTWALGHAEGHQERRRRRGSSCSWATSKDYEKLVGEKLGWARVPAGKRDEHLRDPGVQEGRRRLRRA